MTQSYIRYAGDMVANSICRFRCLKHLLFGDNFVNIIVIIVTAAIVIENIIIVMTFSSPPPLQHCRHHPPLIFMVIVAKSAAYRLHYVQEAQDTMIM